MRIDRPTLIGSLAAAAVLAATSLSPAAPEERGPGDAAAGARVGGEQPGLDGRHRAHRRHLRIGTRRARSRPFSAEHAGRAAGDPPPSTVGSATAGPGVAVPSQAPAAVPAPAPAEPPAIPAPAPVEPPVVGVANALPPPLPSPPAASLTIGIDGGYSGWSESEVRQRVALGAAVTRHEWDLDNPAGSEEEQVLLAAGTIHTRIQALLGGNRLGDATHYREWVTAFVGCYGPGGSFWRAHPELDESRYAITTIELGNEPYFGEMSPELYADTVRPTLERIDQLDLPVRVLLPAYVYGDDTAWIDTLYERIPNLDRLFDGFAFHPYWYGHSPAEPGDAGPIERIETLRRRMDELGLDAKRIDLTEYGESTAACGEECVDEVEQATHLATMIETVASHPEWRVGTLSIFQLLDRGTNSADRELQFGLVRENGTPKPSYAVFRAAALLYR